MKEEIKKALEDSVRILKSKGGLQNKEIKPVILSIEKIIKRRSARRVKKA